MKAAANGAVSSSAFMKQRTPRWNSSGASDMESATKNMVPRDQRRSPPSRSNRLPRSTRTMSATSGLGWTAA